MIYMEDDKANNREKGDTWKMMRPTAKQSRLRCNEEEGVGEYVEY